ncbi:MAG: hypothetical protein IKJ33_02795 [Clostridia bacterium]|nr:hypothetical protein [Clostridia bacterium]
MPLVSKIYSFVSTFISSMILPDADKGMGGVLFGRFFENILEAFANFFYSICKWFLAFMDFLQYFIQKLIGLDYWLETSKDGFRTLGEATTEDIIFKFLYADSVQKVFRALVAIFIILLIIFTIFQIVKSEWDFMTGDGKGGNSKAAIFRSSLKAIVLVLVFPVILVMGIVSSNAILASIVKAVGVDMSETFGGKIFAISAQPANKYRHYVDANAYLPTTDQVTFYLNENHQQILFGEGPDDEYHDYISNYKEYLKEIRESGTGSDGSITMNSIFDPLVPKNTEKFSGFCFKLEDEDNNFKYYFIKADSKSRDNVYYYLTRVLGAKVLNKNSTWASDEVGKELIDGIGRNFNSSKNDGCYITNLNMHKGNSAVRQTARNSWNYSLVYVSPNKKLTQTIASCGNQKLSDYDLGSGSAVGAVLYNSNHISSYFDGGQFGVVQSMAEYSVMADVVDFMCDNNLTFYIMDATSPLVNWNYHYEKEHPDGTTTTESYVVNSEWISSKINPSGTTEYYTNISDATPIYDEDNDGVLDSNDIGGLTFLTKYSNNYTLPAESEQDIIYTASYTAGSELGGSRYIICLRGDNCFYPLVNGKEISINRKEYTFRSSQYDSSYRGVVWAKGTFDTNTVDGYYGNPTYLKNTSTFDNGIEKTTADADGAYYYQFDSTNKEIRLYTYYTQKVGTKLYTYNAGSIYQEGNVTFGTLNFSDKKITITASSGNTGFSSSYVLEKTGKEFDGYDEYASAESGICYVLYKSGNTYKKLNSAGTGLENWGNTLSPCFLTSSGAKPASNLAVRTEKIGSTLNMNTVDGASKLKNQFSIFKDEEYVGTFTKKGLAEIGGLTGIAENTKIFESNWGGKYYNLDVQGKITTSTSGPITGKYNSTLKTNNGQLNTMLVTFEATYASDSVTCYRNQIENFSGNSFASVLIEINVALFKAIFEIKTGIVQQVSDNPFASTTFTYAGANSGLTFDYFFDQNVQLRTFYAAFKINYVLLLVSSVLIIKVLFSSLWGVIKRFYMITLYYLAMPVAASTMPIDNGSRFGNVRNNITGEVLSTYGVLIGLNLFFVLLSPIRDISQTIFTDEMIATSGSYFLKNLHISAKVLNEFIYILFLLVAFTLINELPSFVAGFTGGKDIKASGEKTASAVKSTMQSAGDMISGKALKKSFNEVKSMAPGMIPGGAIIGDAAKKGAKMVGEGAKKFGEGVSSVAKTAGSAIGGAVGGAATEGAGTEAGAAVGGAVGDAAGAAANAAGNAANAAIENASEAIEGTGLEDGNPLDGNPLDDAMNPLEGGPLDEMLDGEGNPLEEMLDEQGNPLDPMNGNLENNREDGAGGPMDENRVREIVREELGMGGGPGGQGGPVGSLGDALIGGANAVLGGVENDRADEEGGEGEAGEQDDDMDLVTRVSGIKAADGKGALSLRFINWRRKQAKENGDAPLQKGDDRLKLTKASNEDLQEFLNSDSAAKDIVFKKPSEQTKDNAVKSGMGTMTGVEKGKTIAGQALADKEEKDKAKAAGAQGAENADPTKATEGEINARKSLKGHRLDLLNNAKDIASARMTLMNPFASKEDKLAAQLNLNEANSKKDKIKGQITADKEEIEKNMTPERKAARKKQITNTIMNGVGAAATVAATVAGGPIAGILVHKTAKNLKNAAPAVMEKAKEKFGELKTKAKDGIKAFKDADGLGKAEMISKVAFKGAGVAAKGALAVTAVGLAAPVVLPALGAVNSVTSAVGVPLWAVGATVLSGKLSKKMSAAQAAAGAQGAAGAEAGTQATPGQEGRRTSTVNPGRGRVVQPGAGGNVPTQGRPNAGGRPSTGTATGGAADNSRTGDSQDENIDLVTRVSRIKATDGKGALSLRYINWRRKQAKENGEAPLQKGDDRLKLTKANNEDLQAFLNSDAAAKDIVFKKPSEQTKDNAVKSGMGTMTGKAKGKTIAGQSLAATEKAKEESKNGRNLEMTKEEEEARKEFGAADADYKTKKKAQNQIAKNARMRNKIANDKNLSQEEKDRRLEALDKDDFEQKKILGIDKGATDSQTKKAAKQIVKDARKAKTDAKKKIEDNMSPDRKAERRDRIANVVMNSVGAAGTVAATLVGGPLAGILVHKTAKNFKKAAPGIMKAASQKFGEFKAADGWGKAEMISNLAMKGAKVAAIGALVAPVAKFAAPALGAVNKLTSAVGAPLALIGGAALTGKLSQKFSGEGGAQQGGGLISRIAAGRAKVVSAGTGADVPLNPAPTQTSGATQGQAARGQAQQAGAKAGAENAQAFTGPSDAEKKARTDLKAHKKERNENKSKRKAAVADLNVAQELVDTAQAEVDELAAREARGEKVTKAEKDGAKKRLKDAQKHRDTQKSNVDAIDNRNKELDKAITDDKANIEKEMTPARKAARRTQIANTVINGLGAAGTVAGTVLGGPIVGLLIHKTAKNVKKAAPAIINSAGSKFGELKAKAKETVKAFRDADGLGKAEIISNAAFKGAGVAAKGALAATAIGLAAPVVLPALGAINKATSAIGIPLWAVGAAGLTGIASKKLTQRSASGASYVNANQGRVVQAGAGANVPETPAQQGRPVAGGRQAAAENARQSSSTVKMPEMTQAEKDARATFDKKKDDYEKAKDAVKSSRDVVKGKEKAQKDAQKQIKKNAAAIKDIDSQIDESDFDSSKENEGQYRARMERNKELYKKRAALVKSNEGLEQKVKDNEVTDADRTNVEKAKAAKKKIKDEKTAAKNAIEENMSPERKAARRDRIANVVMNSVGAAGTVAGTLVGGPIMGLLIHKTAKNVKKAAPGVMNAAAKKLGEFKAADGWGKAEMLSNLAMKGAGVAAVGALVAPVAKFAAPALSAVNKLTSAVGAPLWALGAVGLTSAVGRKVSGGGSYLGSRRRYVQAGAGTEIPNDVASQSIEDEGFTTSPNTSVTRRQTVQQTQNAFVMDESKIAEIVRRVLRGEDSLRTQPDKMQAAAHIVNYGAIHDKSFVENKADAYRNAVVNSIETKGGKAIVGDAIRVHAEKAGISVNDALLDSKKGLVSADSKLAMYKSVMSSEQLENLSNKTKTDNLDAAGQLKFIEAGINEHGLGFKMNASFSKDRGIEFNVTDANKNNIAVRGKGARNEAVAGALRDVMNSGAISSEAVVGSIERTGYMSNTEKAIAKNYALTIDYSKEQSGKTSNAYHQSVFDRARKDEDINAEAIYEHFKNNPDKMERFNNEFHIDENTSHDKVIDTIKNGVANKNPNSIFGSLKDEDYNAELSTVLSKRVGDGSFKVQAFEMLSRKEQLDVADHISANLNAASTGVTYAYTDAEKETKTKISRAKMGDAELVNSFMNSNVEGKDQIVNNLVGAHFGMLDASGNYSADSENAKKMMDEINADSALKAKKDEMVAANQSESDIITGYAKAKVVGDAANFDKYVGNNAHDRVVVEAIMKGEETPASAESKSPSFDPTKPLTNSEFVSAAMADKSNDSNDTVNRMVLDSVGLAHNNGVIDTKSNDYTKMIYEMQEQDHWAGKLGSNFDQTSDEVQQLVLGYSKAKIMGEHTDASKMGSYIGSKANSRNQDVAAEIAKKSETDPMKELEGIYADLEVYGSTTDLDVANYEQAQKDQTRMFEDVKAAFGYVEGGDATTNKAAERAMSKYIGSNGQNKSLVSSQGVNVNSDLLAKVDAKYFTADNNGLTLSQQITANAGLMDESKYAAISALRAQGGESKTRAALEERGEKLVNNEAGETSKTPREFTVASAQSAVDNLKADYLTGDKSVSELNANIQGNFKAGDVANYLRQVLPAEQVETIKKDGAENGFLTLTIAQQNAIAARAAQLDPGARAVLTSNKVDITSLMEISQFLNSPFGEALKERLIAKISQEISALDLFADKLGVNNAGVYGLVQKQTEKVQDASVYEKAQGDLISMERVKANAETSESAGAENIAKNAASRIKVLSKEEKEKVEVEATYDHIMASDLSTKKAIVGSENVRVAEQSAIYESVKARKADKAKEVESALEKDESYTSASERERKVKAAEAFAKAGLVDKEDKEAGALAGKREVIKLVSNSAEGKRLVDIGATQSKLTAVNLANESAIAGGGLARQRSVANAIWADTDTQQLAISNYRSTHRGGSSLENLGEIERNNFLFEHYKDFLSEGSRGRVKVDEIMNTSKVDTTTEATPNAIIKSMSQSEFNAVSKGMKSEGETAVSNIKQNIIKDLNAGGTLTPVPDESKMTKQEVKEFNDSKSQLERDWSGNVHTERFAEVYRNTELVNDSESLQAILSNGGTLSPADVAKAREEALRANGDFMGSAIEAALASKGLDGVLDKVKEFLKSNSGVDYDSLSTADKGKAVQELLNNEKFRSQIDAESVSKGIKEEFDRRAAVATNQDIKQGLTNEQILAFLRAAQGERTRDQLFRIGAHQPHHMFPRHQYENARMHYGFNNPMMRRLMIRMILRRLYREPQLKRMIAEDVASYDSKVRSMTKAEVKKYINEHFSELSQRFGEKILLQKDKNGKYELKQTVNKTVVNNSINELEKMDFSFAGRMKELVKETMRQLVGRIEKSEAKGENDEFSRRLLSKLESSAEFKGMVQRITTPTIQEQIESYFTKGETKNVILETSRRLAEDTEFANRVYNKSNAKTQDKIRTLEYELEALKKSLGGYKRK